MGELERALTALAAEVEWPETPALELRLEAAPSPARRPWWRRPLVVAIALVAVAIGIAFAVPPARSAILDFFHLGGVTVERVSTLPPAEQRPLGAALGRRVSEVEARRILGMPFALPRVYGTPQLYESSGVVSAVIATPEPVLVSELRVPGGGGVLKKVAGASTVVERAELGPGREGLWIEGEQHVVYWLTAPPRLAGNVLLWEGRGVTYRIEGKHLTKERALELARQMTG
jgi:hypothetical protein